MRHRLAARLEQFAKSAAASIANHKEPTLHLGFAQSGSVQGTNDTLCRGPRWSAQHNSTCPTLTHFTLTIILLPNVLLQLLPSLPCSDLPGLIDMLVSAIWSIFFLSAGASLLSWGACKADSLCLSWNGTIGVCFFLWIVYSVTAVVAALDLRAQIQALKGVPPGTPTRE